MEWIVGIWIAVAAGVISGAVIGLAADDEETGFWSGVVIMIAAYIIFGLAVEMPSGYFMKMENGKVVETKIKIIVAWEASPEYEDYPSEIDYYKADGIYFGAIQSPELKYLGYEIHYRVWDENLDAMQLYYDKIVIKNGDIKIFLKEANALVMAELLKESNENVLELIRGVYKDRLAGLGLKLTAIKIEEK